MKNRLKFGIVLFSLFAQTTVLSPRQSHGFVVAVCDQDAIAASLGAIVAVASYPVAETLRTTLIQPAAQAGSSLATGVLVSWAATLGVVGPLGLTVVGMALDGGEAGLHFPSAEALPMPQLTSKQKAAYDQALPVLNAYFSDSVQAVQGLDSEKADAIARQLWEKTAEEIRAYPHSEEALSVISAVARAGQEQLKKHGAEAVPAITAE